jgi:hypothetical protein
MTGEPHVKPARPRLAARIVCTAAPLVLAAGCAAVAGALAPPQPDLSASQLAGSWVSPEGSGTITFYDDYTFTATRLDLNGLLGVRCRPAASASGTWVFESPDGSAEQDRPQYPSGNVVFLTVASIASAPSSTCTGLLNGIQLSTWQINGPLGLCVDLDPDSPCAGEPWVWQKTATRVSTAR